MLSIAPAVADGSYYLDAENYYDADALGDPQWIGKAASVLGFTGPVDGHAYEEMCQGNLPNGTTLGKLVDGERQHAPGWDLTFSAPKSVSIVALVGGDRRLVDAVNHAAREAVTWMEENAACSRFTEDGKSVSRHTGNLAVAMFTHDLTRAQDPQLHVHAVAMNATQGPNGEWRSLDSRHFYWLSKEGGFRFQQALALLVRKLGYEIEVDTTKGTFEIAGVPRAMIETFSTRSKQIIAKLGEAGLTRETATPAEREAAALETRARKEKTIDWPTLAKAWRSTAAEFGVDLSASRKETTSQVDGKGHKQTESDGASEDIIEAVRTAARILAEKEIAFADKALVDAGERQALGRADRSQVRLAIRRLEQEGFLQAREVPDFQPTAGGHIHVQGWTTAEAIAIEKEMLSLEDDGRLTEPPIHGPRAANRVAERAAAQAGKEGEPWQADHGMALFGLLTSENRVVALEGSIGSAADRRVVSTYLKAAEKRGFEVHVMTPSSAAAAALRDVMDRPVNTNAAHLGAQWRRRWQEPEQRLLQPYRPRPLTLGSASSPPRQVWVALDAARLAPSATRDLLKAAAHRQARVVLMDSAHDRQPTASSALSQLHASGMTSFQLPDHKDRYRNEMYLAIAALARSEPTVAFEHIEKAGGQIIEIGARSRSIDDQNTALQQRRHYIADHYANLSPEMRAATRILDLTNKGRDALNVEIRERLLKTGELSGPTLKVEVLIAKPLTRTERSLAMSYRPGDVVRFGSGYRQTAERPAIARGDYLRVQQVDVDYGKVILQKDDGRLVRWQPDDWGATKAAAYTVAERDLNVGENIVWTRKDAALGVSAQQRDRIVNIHPESATVSVDRNGTIKTIDLGRSKGLGLDYGYAETVRARVSVPGDDILAHLSVDNAKMTNLKTLTEVALQSNHLTIVTENKARLVQAAEDRPGRSPAALDGPSGVSGAALDAVRTAADILAERHAVFSNDTLIKEAGNQGLGHASDDDIKIGIKALAGTGQLIGREAQIFNPETREFIAGEGWTTLAAIQDEQKMLAVEQRGRDAFSDRPILSHRDAVRLATWKEEQSPSDRAWNAEQWTATVGILSSSDRVTGLQGFAGTAKTSTVLATVSGAARGARHQVSAMAPTTDAALKLGRAIGADSKTVARHLGEVSRVRPANTERAPVWIVDEASMVSAKTMKDLIRAAEQHDARLILVFDVLQLGSVGAGRGAGQLIEHGMATHYLDHIVRQSENLRMTDAVKSLIRRDPGRALWHMEAAGSELLEAGSEDEAHAAMAKEYASRSSEHRDRSIVIDPTRDGVAAVSDAIRKQLIDKGELTGDPLTATVLEDASLTERERATSTSYQEGQIVRLLQPASIDRQAVARGRYLEVEEVTGAVVTLRDDDKLLRWEPRANSLHVQVFDPKEKELQVGDRIRWSANNDAIKAVSGRLATVVAIDPGKQRIDIEHKAGGRHQLDLTWREHQHFDYGYAVTAQRAQGADAFPIISAPSWRVNTVHLTFAYIAASRTSGSVFMVTDGLDKLTEALETRSGQQIAALDQEKETAGLAEAKVREMAIERVAAQQMANASSEMAVAKEHYRDLGGPGLER
ncbi:MAG: MobF family relaxase [Alphaproteobacteria bacterium]